MKRLPLILVSTVVVAIVAVSVAAGLSANRWGQKAVIDERIASAQIGGFSDDNKRLYHAGLQHIANAHQRVGAFTIGQVVDQESARESHRDSVRVEVATAQSDAKASAETAKATADTARLNTKATAALNSALHAANDTSGLDLYAGAIIEEKYCAVRIDGDIWETAGAQDQSIIKKTIDVLCVAAYDRNGRKASAGGGVFTVRVINLANDVVFKDFI